MSMIDVIDYLKVFRPFENFHSYCDVTNASEGLQVQNYV
jgi:hypothetical protein